MIKRNFLKLIAGVAVFGPLSVEAEAQDGLGPFMPHEGGSISTAWTNAYGPDADSYMAFANVTNDSFDINYTSSRGMRAVRRLSVIDRQTARTLILGFNVKMPLVIPGTTTIGTSTAVLDELRSTGHAATTLVYDADMHSAPGAFTLIDDKGKFSITLDNTPTQVPVVHASGIFQNGSMVAKGDFYFLNNRNNPLLLQYSVAFTGEATPRTERFVRVIPGASERAAMEQALATVKKFTTYGIHFDFDKSSIQNESVPLIREMAATMQNNPLWTINITGYTDSTGDPGYNQKLSLARAQTLKAALVRLGVNSNRMTTVGGGETNPVAPNTSIEGRAKNRRVELARTDR